MNKINKQQIIINIMQSIERAIKRGNAVTYNTGNGFSTIRKKGTPKKLWRFALKHQII